MNDLMLIQVEQEDIKKSFAKFAPREEVEARLHFIQKSTNQKLENFPSLVSFKNTLNEYDDKI